MNEGEHETSSRAQRPHSAKRHLSQRALRWVRHAPWSVSPGSVNKGPQRGVHASKSVEHGFTEIPLYHPLHCCC